MSVANHPAKPPISTIVRGSISRGPGSLPIVIECRISIGLPAVVIVGVAGKTVMEAPERLRGAFAAAGLHLPRQRISLNLAPADVPKNSPGLDLAMAAAILQASGQLNEPLPDGLFAGELGLDGSVRPVRGLIGQLLAAREQGVSHCFIPAANLPQARLVPGLHITPVTDLGSLYAQLRGIAAPITLATGAGTRPALPKGSSDDGIDDVVGQEQAKRALLIAAAGGHNLLLTGPPGTGKSMLARQLPRLLPPLDHEEMLEVTHLHSLAGPRFGRLVTERPFRAPHHSASLSSILGGGALARPGELSLAHRGVLLFDELPEFPRTTLEALRQPLEDRSIVITRQHEASRYPAEIIFVATANPCPCGFLGSQDGPACSCTPGAINRYVQKLSGPLLDRIDLSVTVEAVDHAALLHRPKKPDLMASRQRRRALARARKRQAGRYGSSRLLNCDLAGRQLHETVSLAHEGRSLLEQAAGNLRLSARATLRTLKVARTIADLADSPEVSDMHVAEALQYRHRTGTP